MINISKEDISYSSKIILTINGTGNQQIFSDDYDINPNYIDKIYVNDAAQDNKGKIVFNLNEEMNNITIVWINQIINCYHMFYYLSNITYIDLSHFNSSSITHMTGMFSGCSSLKSLNLNNFDTSKVIDMCGMFMGCSSLISLNLNSFDTSKVTDISYMFSGCSSLESLLLDTFTTSKVNDMSGAFWDCSSLKSLNLNSFDTSEVTSMYGMFFGCHFLESLDLNHFKTSKVSSMSFMFSGCSSLKSLDLHNFDTSEVIYMQGIFLGCRSLLSLNLNNFNTSKVTSMYGIFTGCHSLKSLNLSNFITSEVTDMSYMFSGCSTLKALYLNNFDTSKVTTMSYMFSGCSSLLVLHLNSFDTSKVIHMTGMFQLCSFLISLNINNFDTLKVTSMSSMFHGCSSLISLNLKNFDTSNIASSSYMFSECNPYLTICINETKTYNISSEVMPYKKDCENICFVNTLYKTIKKEDICMDYCNNDTKYGYDSEYNNICYEICDNGTHNSSINDYLCKDCNIIQLFNGLCDLGNDDQGKDYIEKLIRNEIRNGNSDILINQLFNEERDNIIAEYSNVKYEIVDTNYNYNDDKDISVIKLGECENKLKNKYNINKNESLIIFKIDIYPEGFLIPMVEYEIYDSENKTLLNLDVCQDINILYPCNIDINEEYMHNSLSDFYNDICFPYTTRKGTDIILSDRRDLFISNNMSLCEKNCIYNGYDSNIRKSKCQCDIKLELPLVNDVQINKDKLLNNFVDIDETTNLGVMRCYRLLFTKEGIYKNIGHYVLVFIIIMYLLFMILFIKKEYKILEYLIDNISSQKKNFDNLSDNVKKINCKKKILNTEIKKTKLIEKNSLNNPVRKLKRINSSFIRGSKTNSLNIINEKESTTGKMMNNIGLKADETIITDKNYNDFEINLLEYSDALKMDKRTYFQYYISLLFRKQVLLFTFYTKNDYNSRYIKICLLLFSFALYYTVNGLFFTHSTMHKIYMDEGIYNFIYHLPHIIYSTIISSIINIIIKKLSLTENNIQDIKKDPQIRAKIKKCIKIKINILFILSFLFLSFFWFFLSCFCAVYKNTQVFLIEDTLTSFGLSQIYPICLCLLPGIFRIPSLRATKKDKTCIYALSKTIQSFI
jgi:surface protein